MEAADLCSPGAAPSTGCAFAATGAFKIDGILDRRRHMWRGQFDECRLACLASEVGNSAEPSLQPHVVQPQWVCDRIYAMLSSQLDRSPPQRLGQLRPLRLGT